MKENKVCPDLVATKSSISTKPSSTLASTFPPPRPVAHRRRFPRFAFDTRVEVTMFQQGEHRSCWGRSTELGQDGVGATLTGSLELGEIVTLEIPLPLAAYPLKVRAIVRFTQGLRYGFEFLTLTASQRDTVQRVCQYLAIKS